MTSEREKEIIQTIRNTSGIRIKELAKKLKMWDSNLRKIIKELIKEGKVERFEDKDYTCVKLKV